MNWYAYCGNDPVNFIDPEGMRALTDAELNNEDAACGLAERISADRERQAENALRFDGKFSEIEAEEKGEGSEDETSFKVGVGLKGALIFGLGFDVGFIWDSTGGFGTYGSVSIGTGWQIGIADPEHNIIMQVIDCLLSAGLSGSDGGITDQNGSSFTAEGGAAVLGSWDLENPNGGVPSGISGVGIAGGIWKTWTGVWEWW